MVTPTFSLKRPRGDVLIGLDEQEEAEGLPAAARRSGLFAPGGGARVLAEYIRAEDRH